MAHRAVGALVVWAAVLLGAARADDAGFVDLFDGKTLNGWVAEHADRFAARDGVIACDGGTGWLRTAKAYKDFEFEAEYRVMKPAGDSGLFFRAGAASTPQGPHWPAKAYQLQVIDGASNLLIFGHGTPPPKCDRKADVAKAMKKPGEWQKFTLKVVGQHAEATLNGTLVTVSDGVALPEGHLGLEGENSPFEWRNLKIKVLPPR